MTASILLDIETVLMVGLSLLVIAAVCVIAELSGFGDETDDDK